MFCIDIDKLNGKIVERGTTKEALAAAIGINRSTLHRRLKNGSLRVGDVHKICEVLRLTAAEAMEIFLSQKSQKCYCEDAAIGGAC